MYNQLKKLAVIVVAIGVILVAFQIALAEYQEFYSAYSGYDEDWPWKSSWGSEGVGTPNDSYHASINHWNPTSDNAVGVGLDDAAMPVALTVITWTDVGTPGGGLDFTQSASVVDWGNHVWDPDNDDHAPAAFPNLYMGCHWGQCTHGEEGYGGENAGAPFPIRAEDVESLRSTFRINVGGDADNGVWNAAFDIWLDTGTRTVNEGWTDDWTPPSAYEPYHGFPILPGFPGFLKQWDQDDQGGQNDGAEIMIWMNYRGYDAATHSENPIQPAGEYVGTITIPGIGGTWDVWVARSGSVHQWNVISYVRTTGANEMVDFDANLFIQNAMTQDCPTAVEGDPVPGNKCVQPTWWVTSVPAGFEIWAHGEGLQVTEFEVFPDTDVQVETGRTMADGVTPLIHWGQRFLVRYKPTCEATAVEYRVIDSRADTDDEVGDMVKVVSDIYGTTDMWAARPGPLLPQHDPGVVRFTATCEGGSQETVDIPVFIDPSGVVYTTLGEPIEGAEVTLEYVPGASSTDPEPAPGDFVDVNDGDDSVMCPPGHPSGCYPNTDNPTYTNAQGFYRWDVADGWYKVRARKDGCHAPGDPGQPYVESEALPVTANNPATGVDLILDCGGSSGLPVEVTTFTDWGTGYCANVVVTNNTAEALDWQAAFTVEDGDAIYNFWNVIWSQSGTQVAIEGVGWNNILQPDESTHSLGFCATRSDGNNGSGTCEVTYDVRNQWNWGFTADITLKNTGPTPINGWTLAWAFPNGQVIYEAWGSSIIGAGPNASIQNASWNANLAPGQTVGNIGFNAHHFGVNGEPVSFTLNGQSCTVK